MNDVTDPVSGERQKVRFSSGGGECAAWHYPGDDGSCVIMAGGFAVTKEPGTDLFARRFHDAGFGVLAFDCRGFGESGGRPRQVASVSGQLADWRAAVACAATLPGVDRNRLAVWRFSASAGHLLRVAARTPHLAAVIAQTPNVGGLAAARLAARHQKPLALLRLFGRGVLDAAGGLLGRPPLLVPLSGEPGTVAVLTTPDTADVPRALNPGDRSPDWRQEVAARSALGLGFCRPGRDASRVRCPLHVVVGEQDRSASPTAAVRATRQAPRAELVWLPGGHYAPFLDAHERAADAELSFLRRHVLDSPVASLASVERG
ncbi:alpha/beta hydrolase [Streptomyces sp. NPDC097610]|uniref:alpha/beta hydrolase n=1 Tax=Streptomyces sp. NPDC097610 TaxID=3157227 RepID=UPI00331B9981